MTGLPGSILVSLSQPSGRSALALQFANGSTPSWYATLPSAVQSYVESLEKQIAGGGVNLSATPTVAATGPGGADLAASTSKAWAAKVTGAVGVNVAVVLGVLGAVVAL